MDTSFHPNEDFIKLLNTFLCAIENVFPECDETKKLISDISVRQSNDDTLSMDALISEWYADVKPYLQDFLNKKFVVIPQIRLLRRINMVDKWKDPDFDENDQNEFWKYIINLNFLASQFCEMDHEQNQQLADTVNELINNDSLQIDENGNVNFNIQELFKTVLKNTNNIKNLSEGMQGNPFFNTEMLTSFLSSSQGFESVLNQFNN